MFPLSPAYISPATGQLRNAERANLGTLAGAVCFLIGALLLLPERTEEVTSQVAAPSGEGPVDHLPSGSAQQVES